MTSRHDATFNRRRLLRAGGATAAALAVGAWTEAGWSGPAGSQVPSSRWFDLDAAARRLFANKGLHHQRTVMQSFAIDSIARHVYVVQIVQAGTPLPGDAPGEHTYAQRARRGDLTMTRLDLAGNKLGHMYLKGYGHGVSIGLERLGRSVYLWTEVDAATEGDSGWGTRLARFEFRDGHVLDAASSPEIQRRDLLPGVDRTTVSMDPGYQQLTMRYRRDGGFRYAIFDLGDVRRYRRSYTPRADVGQPSVLAGTTFQGFTTFGQYLYLLDGTAYRDSNPPESHGNIHLTRVNLRSGDVEQRVRTMAGHELHRREPEGMTVYLSDPGELNSARLCFGVGTSLTADPADDRLCTIYCHDSLRS